MRTAQFRQTATIQYRDCIWVKSVKNHAEAEQKAREIFERIGAVGRIYITTTNKTTFIQ